MRTDKYEKNDRVLVAEATSNLVPNDLPPSFSNLLKTRFLAILSAQARLQTARNDKGEGISGTSEFVRFSVISNLVFLQPVVMSASTGLIYS